VLRLDRIAAADPALHDVSLTVGRGARDAVIAPPGAVAALRDVISGAIRPRRGLLEFAGRNVTDPGMAGAPQHAIGYLPGPTQPAQDQTVKALVTAAARAHQHRPPALHAVEVLAASVIGRCGLTPYADTPVSGLPSRAWWLLDIAVAVAARPQLIVVAEPTPRLIGHDRGRLLYVLGTLPEHVAVLTIAATAAHVIGLARRVTVIRGGRSIPPVPAWHVSARLDLRPGPAKEQP